MKVVFLIFILLSIQGVISYDNINDTLTVDSPIFHEFPWTPEDEEEEELHITAKLENLRIALSKSLPTEAPPSPAPSDCVGCSATLNVSVSTPLHPANPSSPAVSDVTRSSTQPAEEETTTPNKTTSDSHDIMSGSTLSPQEFSTLNKDQEINDNIPSMVDPSSVDGVNVIPRPFVRSGDVLVGSSPLATATFLQPTESAAILAAVFVTIALIGYVGLLVWRRVLEKRYGNRELLVNEEFYDVNDLKYFEL